MTLSVRLRRLLLPAAAVCGGLLAPASAARADATGTQIVGYLNAQRAQHGFPADLVQDTSLSSACRQHNHYGAANDTLQHSEDPGKPGYTAAGDAAAGQAVLYQGSTWSPGHNPFEYAPIHLMQLLSPLLNRVGAWESEGYGCATTLASLDHPQPSTDTLLTYPANGTRGWRASEVDREGPFTPGETAGVAQGTETGPTLYVLASGPGVQWTSRTQVLSASLAGPDGKSLPLLTFDRTSPQVGDYLPAGAQLLPRAPLAAGTTYTAAVRLRVSVDSADREVARTWSFTTAGAGDTTTTVAPTATGTTACTTRVRFGGLDRGAARVRRLTVRATACRTTVLRVTVKRGARTVLAVTRQVRRGPATVRIALPRRVGAGRYTVRMSMAGATATATRAFPAP